jgi:hypothetical protein
LREKKDNFLLRHKVAKDSISLRLRVFARKKIISRQACLLQAGRQGLNQFLCAFAYLRAKKNRITRSLPQAGFYSLREKN